MGPILMDPMKRLFNFSNGGIRSFLFYPFKLKATASFSGRHTTSIYTCSYYSSASPIILTRTLFHLSGLDSKKFLQSVITNNIELLFTAKNYILFTAFLNAKGRVLFDAFLYLYPALTRSEDVLGNFAVDGGHHSTNYSNGFIIDVHEDNAVAFEKHLKTYFLRSNLELKKISDDWKVAHWDSTESQKSSSDYSSYHDFSKKDEESSIFFKDPRHSSFGYRQFLSSNKIKSTTANDPRIYLLKKVIYGIPESPRDMPIGDVLPFEYNFDLMNGIDFHKGCYLGQELTIRTKHTGIVRKRIFGIKLTPREQDRQGTSATLPLVDECEVNSCSWENLLKSYPDSESLEKMVSHSPLRLEAGHTKQPVIRWSSLDDIQQLTKEKEASVSPMISSLSSSQGNKIISLYGSYGLASFRLEDLLTWKYLRDLIENKMDDQENLGKKNNQDDNLNQESTFLHCLPCTIHGEDFYIDILSTSVAYVCIK